MKPFGRCTQMVSIPKRAEGAGNLLEEPCAVQLQHQEPVHVYVLGVISQAAVLYKTRQYQKALIGYREAQQYLEHLPHWHQAQQWREYNLATVLANISLICLEQRLWQEASEAAAVALVLRPQHASALRWQSVAQRRLPHGNARQEC